MDLIIHLPLIHENIRCHTYRTSRRDNLIQSMGTSCIYLHTTQRPPIYFTRQKNTEPSWNGHHRTTSPTQLLPPTPTKTTPFRQKMYLPLNLIWKILHYTITYYCSRLLKIIHQHIMTINRGLFPMPQKTLL